MRNERDKQWSQTAVRGELRNISACHGDNPHRPDSEWWKCVIRLASVLKGSGKQYFTPSNVLIDILHESPYLCTKGENAKIIPYLWGRAMNQANPRYRIKSLSETDETTLSPVKPPTPKPTFIYEHDLRTGKTAKIAVTPQVAAKSCELRQLLTDIVSGMETQRGATLSRIRANGGQGYGQGNLPNNGATQVASNGLKFHAFVIDDETPNGKRVMRLQFRNYGDALRQCVVMAVTSLGGGIFDDKMTGVFDVILPRELTDLPPVM